MEIFLLIIAIFIIYNLLDSSSTDKQQIKRLEKNYNDCNQKLEEKEQKIKSLKETILNQNFQLNEFYKKLENKETEVNKLESKIKKLNTKIKKSNKQYLELKEIRKNDLELLENLNEQVNKQITELNKVKEQKSELLKEIDKYNKSILEKQKEIEKLQSLLENKYEESNELNTQIKRLNQLIQEIKFEKEQENKVNADKINSCKITNVRLESKIKLLKSSIEEKDKYFEKLKNLNDDNIIDITSLLSDFILLEYKISEQILLSNKRPAKKEAKRINELKKETRKYISQYKIMKYKYEFLLRLFPELEEFVDSFETIQNITKLKNLNTYYENYDNVRKYVTKEEYLKLSEIERNQLALDNYIKSHKKSKWQIGRDYELMCGIDYINDGWNVEFFGIEKKFKDMGRDLIARKGNEIHVVQCKLWSKNKVIHENHIAQLYGTTNTFEYDKLKLANITPVFITNTELSKTAQMFANVLEVKVVKKEMKEFPRIKCNVTKDANGKEVKIYHLPFDQQYDRTHIKNEGEFYAYTVKEAVEKGFRRALKFNFNKNKK